MFNSLIILTIEQLIIISSSNRACFVFCLKGTRDSGLGIGGREQRGTEAERKIPNSTVNAPSLAVVNYSSNLKEC